MEAKPLPKKFVAVWKDWPTFDAIRDENKELKAHELRKHLRSVPCYRCEDKSVRYNPEHVRAVLLEVPEDPENDNDGRSDDLDADLSAPRALDSMLLVRELSRQLGDSRREKRDIITVMEQPLKMFMEALSKLHDRLDKRLDHYEGIHDRMLAVVESLMSEEHTRKLDAAKLEQTKVFREQTMGVAQRYLPKLLEQFKPNMVASMALQAFASLEPELVDQILAGGVLTDEQAALFTKLRTTLAEQRSAKAQPKTMTPNGAATPPS
ncbi:MAG: hypothetical protein ABW217_02980 [Polyangiaceae bacterium]